MLLASDPRAIVIAPDRVAPSTTAQLRFDAAYAIAWLAGGSTIGHTIPTSELQILLRAVTDRDRENNVWRRTVQALSRRARKELERALDEIGVVIEPSATAAWESEERQRALYIGVVASCDLRAVARSVCPSAVGAGRDQRRAGLRACATVIAALRLSSERRMLGRDERLRPRVIAFRARARDRPSTTVYCRRTWSLNVVRTI